MGESSRNGKMMSSKYYCQRAKRCSVLEPVLEHCELAATTTSKTNHSCPSQSNQKAGISLRILSKLRDCYVKLMNDVASGADLGGVSAFYGVGYGAPGTGEPYPSNARVVKETEKELLHRFASQSQRQSSTVAS